MELAEYFYSKIRTPFIIAGGIGKTEHILSSLSKNYINAVSTAHLLNFIGDALQNCRDEAFIKNMQIQPFPQKWTFYNCFGGLRPIHIDPHRNSSSGNGPNASRSLILTQILQKTCPQTLSRVGRARARPGAGPLAGPWRAQGTLGALLWGPGPYGALLGPMWAFWDHSGPLGPCAPRRSPPPTLPGQGGEGVV